MPGARFFAWREEVEPERLRGSEGTRALMVELYRHLLVERKAPAAALRAAKLARRRTGGAERHPYHWAAFVA